MSLMTFQALCQNIITTLTWCYGNISFEWWIKSFCRLKALLPNVQISLWLDMIWLYPYPNAVHKNINSVLFKQFWAFCSEWWSSVSNPQYWMNHLFEALSSHLFPTLVRLPRCLFYFIHFRELLLGQLVIFIKQTRDSFMQKTGVGGKGFPKGMNIPEAVNNIVYVQQLIAKVRLWKRFTPTQGDALRFHFLPLWVKRWTHIAYCCNYGVHPSVHLKQMCIVSKWCKIDL